MAPAEQPHSTDWNAGWYMPAHAVHSPNFGPRPDGAQVSLIVVHSISLPPGEYGGDEVAALFTNRLDWDAHPYFQQIRGIEVSAHFFIRREGAIWQFVSTADRAWHAGRSCYQGRDNCNDYSVGIELEGLEGQTFMPQQYDALAKLCASLATQLPITNIAGHEHVAPGRKADPGAGFDWHRLQRMLGWPARCFPRDTP